MIHHIPVLLKEVAKILLDYKPKNIIDFTFGAGGHSRMFLEKSSCNLIAIDRDPSVKKFADILKEEFPSRFKFYNDISSNMIKYREKNDFIFGDLGFSQIQLNSSLGFSYSTNSLLEMTMGVESLGPLKDILPTLREKDIYNILMNYGEEPSSRKISIGIYNNRYDIKTSKQLKNIILANSSKFNQNKTLSRCFQSFRIYINREMDILENTLLLIPKILSSGGLVGLISFHSLEDRLIKMFFKKYFSNSTLILPSSEEIKTNPQSRSAKLRFAFNH